MYRKSFAYVLNECDPTGHMHSYPSYDDHTIRVAADWITNEKLDKSNWIFVGDVLNCEFDKFHLRKAHFSECSLCKYLELDGDKDTICTTCAVTIMKTELTTSICYK